MDSKSGDSDTSSESENVSVSEQSKVLLSDSQKKTLENAIKKQKKFMDGEITKKKLSKKDKESIDTIESSGMTYKEVGNDLKTDGWNKVGKTKCILVKNFTKTLVDSGTISMIGSRHYYMEDTEEAVTEGLRLGTILGRKLSVRTESRDTKYTRKDAGRIDKRLIAELGFGNTNVFSQTFVDTYPDAFLHISVDASGSMGGGKWTRTMKSVVAMTKAIDMIEGVDVVVSFRSTQSSSGRGRKDNPLMLIAYDSRKDSLVKVKTLFKYLRPSGTTPEGLCYEAIMDEMVEGMKDRESYFLNFSDGMPMFGNDDVDYHYDTALNHTKKMVKEIRNRGIKVLSYYIGDSYDSNRNMNEFKTMYGKDSQFVDVTSVTAVSRTMNKKFLEKN
jgi:nitric oxide reductase activation protein